MQYRILGRTQIKISEIGFGCWGMGGGWGPRDDKKAILALQKASHLGITFFDTALAYGQGHSENLVAQALGNGPATIATKIPPKNGEWPARANADLNEVFPKDWIRKCTEKSLKNLKKDCIDLQQFHVWNDVWTAQEEWKQAIQKLKQEGKIRFAGISINDHEPENILQTIDSGLIDTVQVIYNIFDQSPQEKLFPVCLKKNIGVIVRVPLDEGGLSGKLEVSTQFHTQDWRNGYFRGKNLIETVQRTHRLKFLIRDEIKTLAQGALKFCLSHPAVSTVITGMRTPDHVEENCTVSDGKLLEAKELTTLKAHAWKRGSLEK